MDKGVFPPARAVQSEAVEPHVQGHHWIGSCPVDGRSGAFDVRPIVRAHAQARSQ